MANKNIRNIFNDATTLEINSMLVDGITGCKIPGVTIAFFETISAWVEQFADFICRLERQRLKIDPETPIVAAINRWTNDQDLLLNTYGIKEVPFNTLACDPHIISVLDTSDLISFRRIVNDQLSGRSRADEQKVAELNRFLKIQSRLSKLILRFKNWYELDPAPEGVAQMADRDDHELRKLWELKDGYIFAQNIVQLDGDIITRYNIRLYRDTQIKEQSDQLLKFHKGNVEVGMKHWHFIVETITSIAKALTGIFAK